MISHGSLQSTSVVGAGLPCSTHSSGLTGNDAADLESRAELPQLPTEMWLEILEILDHRTLSRIALTCKELRHLSIPLLHRELHICLPRLGRWKVPDMVTLRAVKIIVVASRSLDFYRIPQALLARLPQFINLESLTLIGIDFDPSDWLTLHRMLAPPKNSLPRLTSLTLERCHRNYLNSSYTPLHLSRIHVKELRGLNWDWDHMVSSALINLSASSIDFVHGVMPRLPQLRSLHISEVSGFRFLCDHILSSGTFPNLETFHIEPHVRFQVDAFPSIRFHFPNLRSYCGPHNYAPIFARSASLIHASLWRAQDFRFNNIVTTSAILLELVRVAPALKTLRLYGFRITTPILDIIGQFSALEELVIDLKKHSGDTTRKDVLEALLPSKLPSSLKELRIFDQCYMGDRKNQDMYNADDSTQLAHFFKRQPNLKYASLSVHMYQWNTYGLIP